MCTVIAYRLNPVLDKVEGNLRYNKALQVQIQKETKHPEMLSNFPKGHGNIL